jgi:hypothetical protein
MVIGLSELDWPAVHLFVVHVRKPWKRRVTLNRRAIPRFQRGWVLLENAAADYEARAK